MAAPDGIYSGEQVRALEQRIAELENQVYKLERELARKKQYINTGADQARAEERERCAELCRAHGQRCLEKASSYTEPDAGKYMTRSDTAMSLAAQISALGDE